MVNAPLLRTKLNRPPIAEDHVSRQHLLERLERNRNRPFVLVSAPAGFGKSTLLSAWLESSAWPGVWLSLGERDSDLITFLSYFIAAVQTRFPDVGQETLALLHAPALPPLPVLVGSLSNELERVDQPFILVLDDYHVVHEAAIHTLLTELLRHPPRSLHLALATRHDPPLPLGDLRARARLTELRAPDLRFSPEECQAFLQNLLGVDLDAQAMMALEESTEGWAAGLRLVALSLPQLGRPGNGSDSNALIVAQRTNAGNVFVMDYLVSEVLVQQPADVQEFVLKTSILERMCGPLCEAVVGANAEGVSGSAQLERIRKANLFVIPLARDGRAEWYRYHHTFRDFLQRHLERSCSRDEIADLHLRASAWLEQHGLIEEALQHAIAASDFANAVRIFSLRRHALLNDEQWHLLRRWLELFPRQVAEEHPELLLTEAWLARSNARWLEMPLKLDRAEAIIARKATLAGQSDDAVASAYALDLRGELDCLRSYQLLRPENPSSALFHAQRGLETTPVEWWSARLLARLHLAGCFHYMGDDRRALATMYDGMTELPLQDSAFRTRLLASATFIHLACADLDGLVQVAQSALALSGDQDRPETIHWAHYMMGAAHYWRNELSDAEGHFATIVAERYAANAQSAVQSVCALALTYQAQGRSGQAREMADLARDFTLEINHPFQLSVASAFQAELAVRQGRLADAQRWLAHQQAPALATPFVYDVNMTASKVLLAVNTAASRSTAAEQLFQLAAHAKAVNDPRTQIEVLTLQSVLCDAQGDHEGALNSLAQALTLAQPSRFTRLFADLGPRMGKPLNEVHARGIATGFVEEVLAAIVQTKPVAATIRPNGLIEPLTDRELEVLGLLAQRLSDKEIAERLIISAGTVKRHTHNIYEKLDVGSRRDAVAKAESLGLLTMQAKGR